MNVAQQTHFIAVLLDERLRITRALDRIAAMSGADNPSHDAHPFSGDTVVGSAGTGPDADVAVAARESLALAEIDEALQLLWEDPERYGICITCGRRIASGRLELVPATRYCERHAS